MAASNDGRGTRGIVTPEAVLLDFDIAGLGSRVVARLIDLMVLGAAAYALTIAGVLFATISEWAGFAFALVSGFCLVFGYPAISEARTGRTVGKVAVGLRVVTLDGGPVRFGQAAVRSVLQIPDILVSLGGIGMLSVLLTTRGQRLGDLAAGTFVIRDAKAIQVAPAYTYAVRGYGWYSSQLDVSSVTPDQYRLIRSFLTRVTELRPDVRGSMAQRLATPISQRMGHQIPPNVHPELFLACVADRYQQRHVPPPPVPVGPA